jgi:hypothetical protein
MAETQQIRLEWGGVERQIDALVEHLQNPAPVLKEFSKGLSKAVKDNIKSGGAGWPPYAQSTLKRLGSLGTSQVTRAGKIRASRIKKTVSAIKRHEKKLHTQGWSPAWQEKTEKLKKRLTAYRKAEAVARSRGEKAANAEQTLSELRQGPLTRADSRKAERARKAVENAKTDRIGKRQSETRKLLEKMPGTIRSRVKPTSDGARLTVFSAAGPVGGAHNYGEGRDPQRLFLPP